jgi:hypothetical protein
VDSTKAAGLDASFRSYDNTEKMGMAIRKAWDDKCALRKKSEEG